MSSKPSLLIIVSTYNEMENLPSLVSKLFRLLPDTAIVVVDDNSPDGTGRWCEEESVRLENLFHIGRSEKLGLGSATIEGFQFGIDKGFDFIATMDADWSHDPHSMRDLWDWVRQNVPDGDGEGKNFGAVIGSRYVKGGKIEGWPFTRRVSSKVVNAFTRLMLRVPVRDNTGAFRIYSAEALDVVDVNSIQCQGYGYLEELVFLLHRNGFQLHEQPITFTDREKGKSKASISEGFKVLLSIFRLAVRRSKH